MDKENQIPESLANLQLLSENDNKINHSSSREIDREIQSPQPLPGMETQLENENQENSPVEPNTGLLVNRVEEGGNQAVEGFAEADQSLIRDHIEKVIPEFDCAVEYGSPAAEVFEETVWRPPKKDLEELELQYFGGGVKEAECFYAPSVLQEAENFESSDKISGIWSRRGKLASVPQNKRKTLTDPEKADDIVDVENRSIGRTLFSQLDNEIEEEAYTLNKENYSPNIHVPKSLKQKGKLKENNKRYSIWSSRGKLASVPQILTDMGERKRIKDSVNSSIVRTLIFSHSVLKSLKRKDKDKLKGGHNIQQKEDLADFVDNEKTTTRRKSSMRRKSRCVSVFSILGIVAVLAACFIKKSLHHPSQLASSAPRLSQAPPPAPSPSEAPSPAPSSGLNLPRLETPYPDPPGEIDDKFVYIVMDWPPIKLQGHIPARYRKTKDFNIHGSWISRKQGGSKLRTYHLKMTRFQLEELLKKEPKLDKDLTQHWKSFNEEEDERQQRTTDLQFWRHEWNRHGIFQPLPPLEYFGRVIERWKEVDLLSTLRAGGIHPNGMNIRSVNLKMPSKRRLEEC